MTMPGCRDGGRYFILRTPEQPDRPGKHAGRMHDSPKEEPMEKNAIRAEMIAPCGLDCSLCGRALAEKDPCPGCLGPDENKPEFCSQKCGIILCRKRQENGYAYCDECPDYPCADVQEKENRYTSRYPLYESPGKNLREIRESGMEKFLEKERDEWTCR